MHNNSWVEKVQDCTTECLQFETDDKSNWSIWNAIQDSYCWVGSLGNNVWLLSCVCK